MAVEKSSFQSPSLEQETIESLSRKLFEANLQLKQLQQEREEMLANISHDLRAPITAIRSAVDYLRSGQPLSDSEIQSSLRLIDHRTATLENLVQDMYYLFCVEDTSRALQTVTLDAIPFLEEAFFDITSSSRYETHDIILDLPEGNPCRITIDIQKIIRVLENLMTNAEKYSAPDSRIVFRAFLEKPEEGESPLLSISVTDNGIGIPPEAIPKLFHRTFTVSSARTPGSPTGSGLGLAIAQAITRRHGGSIRCESTPGKGSCFTVTLPCTLTEP